MPKMKTHSGASKRFKVTGSGKIKRSRANKSHILAHKKQKRTRKLRTATTVSKAQYATIKKLLQF